jgi:hypothetical protein
MRTTKKRLTQIIKEEVGKVNEVYDDLTTLQDETPASVARELVDSGTELSDDNITQAAIGAGVLDDDLPNFVDAVWEAVSFEPRSSFGIPHSIGEQSIKITKKQLTQIIKEETEKVLEMHDLDDEYGGGAYTSPGSSRGGMAAHAPRTGESVDLGGEIVRLAQEAGVEPYDYLIGLGFSEESADNLLGMTNLLDQVKGGMTFRENRRESE